MTLKKEEKNKMTDQAWNKLYNRLEQDGLLVSDVPEEKDKTKKFSAWSSLSYAAVVLFCIVSGITLYHVHVNSLKIETMTLHNEKGKPTLVNTLEDGSIVYLSEQTSLEYPDRFAKDKREVFLQGEAFFEVSGNRKRPFIIDTKSVMIEVIGTAFDVKSKDQSLFSLSVRNGEVKVTSKKNGASVYVKAGETVLLQSDKLETLQTNDFGKFNEYMKYIHFKDHPLTEVIRIINQNTDSVQIKIAPEVSDRLLTVTFFDNSPGDMAELICLALNLQLIRNQNIIYITQP